MDIDADVDVVSAVIVDASATAAGLPVGIVRHLVPHLVVSRRCSYADLSTSQTIRGVFRNSRTSSENGRLYRTPSTGQKLKTNT